MRKSLSILVLATVLLLTVTAIAADKVVVIPLNSTSPLYVAGTEITSLPYTISSSGFYFLTKDLTSDGTSMGIIFNADNVTIDLMGFSLIGPGTGGGGPYGIYLGLQSNIEIRNGTVRDFKGGGISTDNSGDTGVGIRIINIRAINNGTSGINLYYKDGNIIDGCTAIGNGNDGIVSGTGSIVTGNISNNNGEDGIDVSNNSTVVNNTCINNTGMGFNLNSTSLVHQNTAVGNGTNIDVCGSCVFGTNVAP